MKITKKMNLIEVVNKKPEAMEILSKYGMHCIGCAMAHFETLEDGCRAHGMSNKDINKMIKEINSIKKTKK